MITRGYFIGQIIDHFAEIREQINFRAKLRYFDLHVMIEDHMRKILNLVYGYSLENVNRERSNAPGIDLADEANRVAYQITAVKTSAKVNETLAQVQAKFPGKFDRVFVLIVGHKQDSYTIDPAYTWFSTTQIVDLQDIAKDIVGLPDLQLKDIYELVKESSTRIRVELEVPDEDGSFKTDIESYCEVSPTIDVGDLALFKSYLQDELDYTKKEIELSCENLREYQQRLARLPRITRGFLGHLMEMRDIREDDEGSGRILYDVAKRKICYPDFNGEMTILQSDNLVSLSEPGDYCDPDRTYIEFHMGDTLFSELTGYLDKIGIRIKDVVVGANFIKFSTPPVVVAPSTQGKE